VDPNRRTIARLRSHLRVLRSCEQCPDMKRPVVTGAAVASPVLLVGQAPGVHEGRLDRPFAWTAGKTMFGWFGEIGLTESDFRDRVYMAAVCRCFPGKNPNGGDRVPSPDEIAQCSRWLAREVDLLRPKLVLPVGKLAIAQVLPGSQKLDQVVGRVLRAEFHGHEMDVIPLPHPSGASTWHRIEPGKTLLRRALGQIAAHPAFRSLLATRAAAEVRA
jgi:uracil-DNA glycosylase